MKLSVGDLDKVTAAWLDEVLLPKSNPIQTAMIMFAYMQTKDKMIKTIAPFLDADENGLFDLDKVKTSAQAAVEKAGGRLVIPVINYAFDADDLTRLFDIAKRFAK